MFIDKEYPATHSMSTGWFIADKDGNIAIFDFNENGPIPCDIPESSANGVLEEDFVLPDEKGIRNFNFDGGFLSLTQSVSLFNLHTNIL